MTLRFIDSFDHYTTNAQLALKWSSVAGGNARPVAAAGRNTTAGLKNSDLSANAVTKTLTSKSTWTVGFALYTTNQFVNVETALELLDSGTAQVGIYVTNTGAISVRRGGGGGTTLATSTNTMSLSSWYYIEFRAVIDNAAGQYEVRVNGTSSGWVPAATGADTQNTANATANAVKLYIQRLDWAVVDDFYVCDGDGSTNNTFLGDIRVEALFPNAVGNSSQFTPTSGDNYTCVDETTPNDDTDYVASSGVGNMDTYGFQNLVTTSGTILGIQTDMYARRDDAGTRTISPVIRYNSTTYSGYTASTLGITYTYYENVMETNPATGEGWVIDEVNASEFGVRVET